MGVYVEYCWLRLGSPDPYASGDSISLVARCFSSSNGCGLVRLLLPDEELDWLLLFWPVGVMIDEICIRETAVVGRPSSALAGPGGSIDAGSTGCI